MTLNEIEQRLDALQAEKDKLAAELEQLKAEEQSKEVKPWRADEDGRYYAIYASGGILELGEDLSVDCDEIFSFGNYYRTRELAELDAKELALRGRVRQLRDALCEGYKFVPQERNFYVFFSHIDKCFHHEWDADAEYIGTIYFDTYEHAQQACDILNAEIGKESGGNG